MPAPHQPDLKDGSSSYDKVEIALMRKEFNKHTDISLHDLQENPEYDMDWCMRINALHRAQKLRVQRLRARRRKKERRARTAHR